jgi:predicted NAD/FAD-binding protein
LLHTDRTWLPPEKRAWASWNYARQDEERGVVTLTYYMNYLQGLQSETDYLVTLNPSEDIDEKCLIKEFLYTHPNYTFDALESQAHLELLNGQRNTWYCGSYFGYGFHEDAFRSGVNVARALGVDF